MNINNTLPCQINSFKPNNFNAHQKDKIKEYLTVSFINFCKIQDDFECILNSNYIVKFNNEKYLKFENIQISNPDGFRYVLDLIRQYSFELKGLILKNINFSSLDVMQCCWKLLSDMEWMMHLEIDECDFIQYLSWQDHEILKSKLLSLSVVLKVTSFLKLVPAYAQLLDHNEVIQSIQFNGIDFFDVELANQISELVLSCSRLKNLKLEECIFSNKSIPVFIKTVLAMPSLNALSLKNSVGFDGDNLICHSDFLQKWKAVLDARNLSSLDLGHIGNSKNYHVDSFGNFFKEANCSLGELKLEGLGIENIQDVFDVLKNQPELGIIDLSNNFFRKEEFIESLFNFSLNVNPSLQGKIVILTFTGQEPLFKDSEVLECCRYLEDEQKLIFDFKEIDLDSLLFQSEENSNQLIRGDAYNQKILIEDHSIGIGRKVEQDINKMWIKLHLEQLKNELKSLDCLNSEWILERKKRCLNIFNENSVSEKFFEILFPSLGFIISDSKNDASLLIYYKIIEILNEHPDQFHGLGISNELNIYNQMAALRSLVVSYLIKKSKSIFLEWGTHSYFNFQEYLLEKGVFFESNPSALSEMETKRLDDDFANVINDVEKKMKEYEEDFKSGEVTLFEIMVLGLLINCDIHIITAKQYFKQVENLNDISFIPKPLNKNPNMNLYFYKKNGYYYRLKKIN